MLFDIEKVKRNVRQAETEDLLDRITVFRTGMEPAAIEVIEEELRRRGVSEGEVHSHEAERLKSTHLLHDGTAARCTFCHRPATAEGWGWHKLWGVVPVFPRFCYYCDQHRPDLMHK